MLTYDQSTFDFFHFRRHRHASLRHNTEYSIAGNEQFLTGKLGNPAFDLELKVALGDNEPKGHLAKSGLYLTCHYVLQKNDIPQIWLLRFGFLQEQHFNISDTAGDSGKNAAINASGIECLRPIYFAPSRCPLPITKRAKRAKKIFEAFNLHYPCE